MNYKKYFEIFYFYFGGFLDTANLYLISGNLPKKSGFIFNDLKKKTKQ